MNEKNQRAHIFRVKYNIIAKEELQNSVTSRSQWTYNKVTHRVGARGGLDRLDSVE
jgi:hypothetical protein